MLVDILFKPDEIKEKENRLKGKAAAVFDVLRATSTIVTALANGCAAVHPAAEIEEALRIARKLENRNCARIGSEHPGEERKTMPRAKTKTPAKNRPEEEKSAAKGVLLGGERGGERVPGFMLGNSPLEYGPETVRGRVLVLTTTNGTRAIRLAAEKAEPLLIGSLLNARATAEKLWMLKKDAVLICAGTDGDFSLEDAVAAGVVAGEILRLAQKEGEGRAGSVRVKETPAAKAENAAPEGVRLTDAAVAAVRLAEYYGKDITNAFFESRHGQKLLCLGRREDLEYCSRRNVYNLVPCYERGKNLILPLRNEQAGVKINNVERT